MDKYNMFTNKNKKNLTSSNFFFKEELFPTLKSSKENNANDNINDNINDNSEIKKSISYVDKLNFCNEDENKSQNKYDLKPGWILITRDQNNKIVTFKNDPVNTLENKNKNTHTFSQEMKRDLKPMLDRWEKYKTDFIELYGEDDYYHYHTFPNYNYDYLNLSDNEVDEYESSDIDEIENNLGIQDE